MAPPSQTAMAVGRGILTEGERRYLKDEEGEQRRYEARSRVRARLTGPLAEDIELLAENQPDLLEEFREIVCEVD